MAKEEKNTLLDSIVALAKRRGFIYQGSEIYGGLAGTWDYGPLGLALKNNIKNLWWKRFVDDREDMYGVDAAILMNQNVWKASGHARGFADMLVECSKCKRRFRADHIRSDLKDPEKVGPLSCPECGGSLGEPRQFYMMLETHIGAVQDASSLSYLRPETAQGMFVNFKNVVDSFHPRLPFGLAQIGKAFRNEIAPRDFTFRAREFEQMEIEYFVEPTMWQDSFEHFRKEMWNFVKDVGIDETHVHELEIPDGDRAHYSKRTIDFEFDFPFGRKELYGLAYRTDYDLKAHTEASKVDLSFFDDERKIRFIPHVIEPSFGVDRTVLAVLSDAYREDTMGLKRPLDGRSPDHPQDADDLGEKRVYLALSPRVAPYVAAVFPLLKNKPALVEKAREVYTVLKKELVRVDFDDNGNIGKRYRRQDEIGTPFCITLDFDSLEKEDVTVRGRDTGKQERVKVSELADYLKRKTS